MMVCVEWFRVRSHICHEFVSSISRKCSPYIVQIVEVSLFLILFFFFLYVLNAMPLLLGTTEMGLGKTLMTIATISALHRQNRTSVSTALLLRIVSMLLLINRELTRVIVKIYFDMTYRDLS